MRAKLPNRRPIVRTLIQDATGAWVCDCGFTGTGQVGEVILRPAALNDAEPILTVWAHDAGIVLSRLLQRGETLDSLGRSLSEQRPSLLALAVRAALDTERQHGAEMHALQEADKHAQITGASEAL